MSICRKIADKVIAKARLTPYSHIHGNQVPDQTERDGDYMRRYWFFNPYGSSSGENKKRWRFLPSIRVHHILRSDDDRAYHDHPWPFVTVILKGGYYELRPIIKERHVTRTTCTDRNSERLCVGCYIDDGCIAPMERVEYVVTGHTEKFYGPGSVLFRRASDWHRIRVPDGSTGAWTLFTTGKYIQKWGFLLNDFIKMPYDVYLRLFGSRQ